MAELVRIDMTAVRARAAAGERKRAEMIRRFPLDQWPSLPLERYALGLGNNEDSFCWWMEYGSVELGGITGGSAHKMMIYKRRNEPGWFYSEGYADEHEAWVDVRDMFVQVFDAATQNDWDAVDMVKPIARNGRMLTRKALHVYFPHEVLAIYSRSWLLFYGQALGVSNLEQLANSRLGLNRALLKAARQYPVFKSLTPLEIGTALVHWRRPDDGAVDRSEGEAVESEPVTAPRYLHLSAGEKGRLWDEWRREGLTSISWNDLGDLTNVTSDAAFEPVRNAALQRNPDWGAGGPRMAWKFRNLRVGDWLIARRGSDTLLGVGRVIGGYFYDPSAEHAHRLPVAWVDTRERQVDYNFGVMSLGEIDSDRFETLAGAPGAPGPTREASTSNAMGDSAGRVAPGPAPAKSPPSGQPSEADVLEHVRNYIRARGYYFDAETVANYHIALKTRPFVILAGLSGTGKSKLTQLYAEALGCVSDDSYLRLAVQPNWTEVRHVLGYMNGITGKWQGERLLDFLLSATRRPDVPHFCCLDEMNLARVEYYFSPMLSAMEEDDESNRVVTLYGASETEQPVPAKVRLGRNLFFVGTINVDETTQNISDKVIDRSNTIEFYDVDLDRLPPPAATSPSPLQIDTATWHGFCTQTPDTSRREQIRQINAILASMRQSVGYRVAREIELYLANGAGLLDPQVAFDLQVRQRILPRVRGDHHIDAPLSALLSYTESNGLSRSVIKLTAMRERLHQDGYTSFF